MPSRLSGAAQVLLSRRPAWSLADQIVVSGANFLTMVVLARQLGLHDFGIFTLYWTSVLFVAALHSAFIILPMVVLHARHDRSSQRIVRRGGIAGIGEGGKVNRRRGRARRCAVA